MRSFSSNKVTPSWMDSNLSCLEQHALLVVWILIFWDMSIHSAKGKYETRTYFALSQIYHHRCRRNTIEDAQTLLVRKAAGYASTWRACAHDPGKSIKPIGKNQKRRSLAPPITSIESLPVIPLLDQ